MDPDDTLEPMPPVFTTTIPSPPPAFDPDHQPPSFDIDGFVNGEDE